MKEDSEKGQKVRLTWIPSEDVISSMSNGGGDVVECRLCHDGCYQTQEMDDIATIHTCSNTFTITSY